MRQTSAGIHLERAAGQTYTIHIPHRHTQGETVPLIVLLHWGGRKYRFIGREILEGFGLPALSEMQAIMVAPDRKRKHWSHPKAGDDLTNLITYLDEHYNLHPTHRAVVGFSMGGQGVWTLGAEHPDLFACGVAVASPVPENTLDAPWDFPVYAIHSELDENFPYEFTAKNIGILQEKQAPVQLHSLEYAAHANVRDYISAMNGTIPWIEEIWAGM